MQSPNRRLEIKKAMSRTHRLLLSKEKLTVSVIYPLILKIFKKNLFFLAHLIIWVVWFLLLLSCMCVLYTHGYEALMKYVICNFFHSIVCLYIFFDGFFYYAEDFEFDVVSLVYFFSSCLCFWWLTCLSYLYSGKQYFISCFICYYLLPFLTKDTNWLNGYKNKTHI